MEPKDFIKKWGDYTPDSWVEEPGDCLIIGKRVVVPLDQESIAVKEEGVWDIYLAEDFIDILKQENPDLEEEEEEEEEE